MSKALNVWWHNVLAGVLEASHGSMKFTYDDEWIKTGRPAISISLPLSSKPFAGRGCRPYFGGLLPEGSQRDAAADRLGVSKANDFGLLYELAGDVAGALELLPPDAFPRQLDLAPFPEYHPLSDEKLVEVIDDIPTHPFLAGSGIRISLAGAQPKLPVVLVDGKIALPINGQATTHILKPAVHRFPAITENEAFAMRLARNVGLKFQM